MTDPVCVISGVGPGTGSALARRFARGGHRVAMLARNPQRLAELERELPYSKGYACDVSDAAQVEATADRIERDLGVPTTLVHNAVGGAFGSFLEIDPAVLNRNFQVNTMGLLFLARRLTPVGVVAGGISSHTSLACENACAWHPLTRRSNTTNRLGLAVL
jgi:NAD(P)-dependent dehydrogenase (short-subunit alcohol dehydrogenase family)